MSFTQWFAARVVLTGCVIGGPCLLHISRRISYLRSQQWTQINLQNAMKALAAMRAKNGSLVYRVRASY